MHVETGVADERIVAVLAEQLVVTTLTYQRFFFFSSYGDHRDLHTAIHSFPTRRSSDLEIVGLSQDLCDQLFEDASDYPGQKSLDDVLGDYLDMHKTAFSAEAEELADAGLYRFRKGAELHATSPEVVRRLHAFVKAPSAKQYSVFEELAETQGTIFLRDLLETTPEPAVPLPEVEPVEGIVKRFSTQAMSLGSLSPEAHRTLALAMNELGARSNTGEGGEDPDTYRYEPAAANKIKQVASARFGVTK